MASDNADQDPTGDSAGGQPAAVSRRSFPVRLVLPLGKERIEFQPEIWGQSGTDETFFIVSAYRGPNVQRS